MSMAISWDNKMDFALCDIMVGFSISSHIYISLVLPDHFLNQACTGLQPARAWFLEIAFVRKVGVCVSIPEGIN